MKKSLFILLVFLLESIGMAAIAAITPNPLISRGRPAYSSAGSAAYLVDNKFGGTTFNVGNNSWIAVNVGSGRSKVFVNWNSPSYSWSDVVAAANSCKNNIALPVNYTIQKSSNSTNGSDGQWTAMATVTGNTVTARGHLIDFTGASWIRMSISSGGGSIDELEVFDLSSNGTDLWFFPGTSITANTYKGSVPAKNFADLIAQARPGFTPVMVRGGIPCINSGNLATDISKYMAMAGNVKYWAIEMGTNDAWGGNNGGVTNFKNNLQTVINACKSAGIQPILARMIATNPSAANWQVHPDYLKAIDDLTSQNSLLAGPDLYGWFLAHPGDLNSDGVHPNASGAASIQRLWAEKMAAQYAAAGCGTINGVPVCCNGSASDPDGDGWGWENNQSCSVSGGSSMGLANGTYSLIARHSGKGLDVNGVVTTDGANVQQWTYSGGGNQKWIVTNEGNGTYAIKAVHSGKALDVNANATVDGANVQQWTYSGGNNQKWKIESVGSGYYRIVSVNSNKCLDVNGSATTDGANVQQWACSGGANQSFLFTYLGTVRMGDEIEERNALIYPNPSAEAFTLEQVGTFSYLIQDAAGKKLEAGEGAGQATIGRSLPPGLYVVRVQSVQGVKTSKLVKQ